MSIFKFVTFIAIIAISWLVVKFHFLGQQEKTVKVFNQHFKIKKRVANNGKTLYYTLYTFKRKFLLLFNAYSPVAISTLDNLIGENFEIKIKFNSVEDAEAYWERNYKII